MAKYNTLKDLIRGESPGNLKKCSAWLDNDNVTILGPHGENLYDGKTPGEALEDALNVIGIKHNNV
jgi:hypothetical protein